MKSFFFLASAVICFHLAYVSGRPAMGLLIFGYAFALVRLADQPSVRRAFYFGLAAGFIDAAVEAFFFWEIFHPAAVILWLVYAFWIGLFTALSCGCLRRWGPGKALWLLPILWTGIEYFRSELYYLRFSWLNIGYALPPFCDGLGMYFAGFAVLALCVSVLYARMIHRLAAILVPAGLLLVFGALLAWSAVASRHPAPSSVSLTGVQVEFPPENVIPKLLDQALGKNPGADIFVLSEYALEGPVPASLQDWCRAHSRYLVVGGKDVVTNSVYYNTAFVIGTNGDIVFKQAKSVPIQFFQDGLPATNQAVWESPWGKIGICICYDLSYTRVTDELVRKGAQLLIVPTMDVSSWGKREHELHARVAPVRAAEYGLPIFRLTSSGISQVIDSFGRVTDRTDF
ncbi:MAG TPA: nitrilase-related carbon-nitrogen hydrolase, partial [Verrucomicrobiae bacterium]|nr:nitrilase-related carbon-nitrogen hydrolase [Verrucomicrobiae bacterium]